ncbi:MAG: DNA repair exonuclease [Chloroflexi bacterium]|nr:DNA repair exonuclease [Chloroflexota bacterium]
MSGNNSHRPDLKILHTSDIHLCPELWPSPAGIALAALVNGALREEVDLFLIAGDLFESNRVPQRIIDVAIAEFRRLSIPVIILPGNHDSYDAPSIYRRIDITAHAPNVRVLTDAEGEMLSFPELGLILWGNPIVDHHPGFRPLASIPSRQGDYWHIALAHGAHSMRLGIDSSPILAEEIANCGWDYIALGHEHRFRDVSNGQVVACYSGSPTDNIALTEDNSASAILIELKSPGNVVFRTIYMSATLGVADQKGPWVEQD